MPNFNFSLNIFEVLISLQNNLNQIYVEEAYVKNVIQKLKSHPTMCTYVNKISQFQSSKGIDIDLVVTLGGDGTLLKASGYFKVKLNCSYYM